jgi:hypothetical protein
MHTLGPLWKEKGSGKTGFSRGGSIETAGFQGAKRLHSGQNDNKNFKTPERESFFCIVLCGLCSLVSFFGTLLIRELIIKS